MRHLRVVVVIAAVVLLCSTSASAGGNGRTEKIVLPPTCYTEVPTVACGDFQVLADWCEFGAVLVRFDSNGNAVQAVYHWTVGNSIYYNSEDPTIMVEGRREHVQNRLLVQDNILYGTGPAYRVIIPGEGAVMLGIGHWKYDYNTDELTWYGGPFEAFSGDVPAMCEVLAQ